MKRQGRSGSLILTAVLVAGSMGLAAPAAAAESDAADEVFFYREDGLFRYYDIRPDGSLGAPILQGDGYTPGWSAITSVDLDGDGQDEIFFYRDDGLYRYYDISSDGSLGAPIRQGDDYTPGWSTVTAVDVDGDWQDEMLFYRDDGLFRYYDIDADGRLGSPISEGTHYTAGWTSIVSVDLSWSHYDPLQDELFFYRDDGLFRYYSTVETGVAGGSRAAGSNYTTGWTSIAGLDLDGSGAPEQMLFYRDDGLYRFYDTDRQGIRGRPFLAGDDYTMGWTAITAVNMDRLPEFPPERENLVHGGSTWAVVLAASTRFTDPGLTTASVHADAAGYRTGATDCDLGIAEALGFSPDEHWYSVSVYFQTEAAASQAREAFQARGVEGTVAQLETYCLD